MTADIKKETRPQKPRNFHSPWVILQTNIVQVIMSSYKPELQSATINTSKITRFAISNSNYDIHHLLTIRIIKRAITTTVSNSVATYEIVMSFIMLT